MTIKEPVRIIAEALSKEAGHDEIHPLWMEQAALSVAALETAGYGVAKGLTFDPPLELVIGEECGAVKPGTYAANHPGGIPTCDSAKGHAGDHAYVVEYLDRWPQVATPYTEQETTNG